MDGVLVVDKPEGLTSFDVVARVRRALRVKKAGHTGTLDPMATGLLPLCLGDATRWAAYLSDGDKEYEATARLGTATDTLDRTGKPVDDAPWQHVSREVLLSALEPFRGPIEQAPPMYSAARVAGRRLHELARRGMEVERRARPVVVHELELLAFEPPDFRFRVRCSKGTYVRVLADEIGRAAGSRAHLTALRRTASGGLRVEQALPLAELEALEPAEIRARLIPAARALAFLPELRLDARQAARVRHGQRLTASDLPALGDLPEKARIRLTAGQGEELVAVAEVASGALRYCRVAPAGPAVLEG